MGKIDIVNLSKVPLGEKIANILRREIMLGILKEDEHLIEQSLSNRFQTSRGPIRDAIMKLEMEGLIKRNYSGRAAVQEFQIKDVKNLYNVRKLIEMQAITSIVVTDKDIESLKKQIKIMKKAYSKNHKDIYADLDFHKYIVGLSKNKALIMVWNSLSDMFHTLIDVTTDYQVFDQEKTISYHEKILNEIIENNINNAAHYLSKHLEMATDYYCYMIEKIKKEGN